MVQQRREPQPPIPASCFVHTFETHRRTTAPALCPGYGDLSGVSFGYAPSRPGELHPEALTDPDVSLSTHPARATP
jgi:hypothetical protein